MSALDAAKIALSTIRSGREAMARIADSVKDGTLALTASDQAELNRMLEQERAETRQAHDDLEQAIREAQR
jgi:ribosomal protein L18